MKNKNLIIGGVILAGIVAYYFYNKNKGGGLASSSSASTPKSPIETNTVSSNNTNSKKKYRVVKPLNFGSGYIKDDKGNMVSVNSLAPKVNSIIELDKSSKEIYLFNKYVKGFDYEINGSKVFIPYDSVKSVASEG